MIIHQRECSREVLALNQVPNEKYFQAIKQGRPNFFLKPSIPLAKGDIIFPGAAYWNVKLAGKPLALPKLPAIDINVELPFTLRDEQVPLFNAALNIRAALIKMTTGGGKSVILMALCKAWGTPTLIVVHNKDMVEQFYKTFEKFLGWKIGRLNGDHKDIQAITVTTFNSAKLHQKKLLGMGFRTLFIDEADLFFTEKGRNFVCAFEGERVFAFSATTRAPSDEYMSAGEIPAMERFYGAKLEGFSAKQVLAEIFYKFYEPKPYRDNFLLPVLPSANWAIFRQHLDQDEERKEFIHNYVHESFEEGDRILVLFDRVEHVKAFYEKSTAKKKYIIYGQIKKDPREEQKKAFLKDGGIMFAQYQTSSRGID